jgi:PAS domain S-box-containing protein
MDERAVQLLLDAGLVLAESLEMERTLGRIARLTVPHLADLCVIDLRDEDGSIRKMAVASANEEVARKLDDVRARQQLDPDGEHPVARVIRSGEPELLVEMTSGQLRSFAESSGHARFMLDHGYHSAAVAPLVARGRTLGALSVLRLADGAPYTAADMDLVSELARRAALAIDNARLFSEVRRVEQRLAAILVNLAEAITLTDEHGHMLFANQAAADLLGADTPAELMSAAAGTIMSRFLVCDEQGRELDLEQMPGRRLFAGEQPEPLLVRNVVRASGDERWLIVRASPVIEEETGRILYAVNVFENITEVKRLQVTESFMAEASRVLASSTDYTETLTRIARLSVAQIADWCAIDVLDEDGVIERVAIHHSDPSKLAIADNLEHTYKRTLEERDDIVAEVIRSGRARIVTQITPAAIAAAAHDREQLELLQALGLTSMIVVPLAAPTRTVGAIALASAESLRRLSRRDVALAERLARRVGTAVESARLYTERTRIANILQAALLPESLPEIAGVQIESLYRAAGELNDVGGDFYDVLPYGNDRWLVVIGDVCGKGPRAAGVTALARHTLRTAALLGQTPAGMLRTLHSSLSDQQQGADLCTVCLVTLEPRGERAELTITLAGHPQPLHVSATGSASLLGEPGTLLGVIDPIEINEVQAELRAGETLLLYTDGLTEAGASASGCELGEERLLELGAIAPQLSLDDFLQTVERTARDHADGKLRDDIALIALRLPAPERVG